VECGLLGNLVWSCACFMTFEVGVADDVHTRVFCLQQDYCYDAIIS